MDVVQNADVLEAQLPLRNSSVTTQSDDRSSPSSSKPLRVSVLIPSYNHRQYLRESIASIWSQNVRDVEIVVVDDGSTDDSLDELMRLQAESPIPMIVLSQTNRGLCYTLNRALAACSGDIIAILASDDMMAPKRLLDELPLFTNRPELRLLIGDGVYFNHRKTWGQVHQVVEKHFRGGLAATRAHLLSRIPAVYLQASLFRKDFLVSLGGFDEDTGSDDWSLFIRAFSALESESEWSYVNRTSFLYRSHAAQIHLSRRQIPMVKRVIRKFFPKGSGRLAKAQVCFGRAQSLLRVGRFRLAKQYMSLANAYGCGPRQNLRFAVAAVVRGSQHAFQACRRKCG